MTDQEAFDIVAHHLLTQRERSENHGMCAYRGRNGLKCAIGALIPDSDYHPGLEGRGACEVRWKLRVLQSVNVDLLSDLQKLHDKKPPVEWTKGLRAIARDYRLDASVLDYS